MKTIQLKCEECGTFFDRPLKEYKRNKNLGRKIFCGLSCSNKDRNKGMSTEFRRKYCYDISKHYKNRQNEYSPFVYFVAKSKCQDRIQHYGSSNITKEYLKQLWDQQNGTCPYTGIKMILPENSQKYFKMRSLKRASLDRIDSSKGYVEGNVEFVCYAINMAKNSFTREQMKEFVLEIGGPAQN